MSYQLVLSSSVILFLLIFIPTLIHLTHYIGRSKRGSNSKNEVYESGIKYPHTSSDEKFNVKYYLVAIIFILFDVETLFMFPWAVTLRELGLFGLMEMFTFIALLFAGLIYVYKKGALKWA